MNWDQDRHLHPDERYMTVLASMLRPPESLAAYFDSGASTLNPFNTDWGRSYVYGTLPLFAGRYLAEFMDAACGPNPAAIPRAIGVLLFGRQTAGCEIGTFTGYDNMALLGRLWSGLADLCAVALLFVIGRRLFGWRAGLLAAAFSALAVLQIQQAHFFTVDSTANLCVVLTILFCVRMVTRPASARRWTLLADGALAGLAAGCGLASKISVWPLVGLITLGVVVALARDRGRGFAPLAAAAAALILAGLATFAAFRAAQPYAFVGTSASEFQLTLEQCRASGSGDALQKVCALAAQLPEPVRALVAPSARWIQQLDLAQGFVNGTIDAPFGHQWANRAPIVFPLINLVFWGMGISLGLAACVGLLAGLRQILRDRRWWAYLIPVVWGGLYFLYQSTQWTKSMRYLLPVYPMFCLLAAAWLVGLWRTSTVDSRKSKVGPLARRIASGAAIPVVLAGTLIWALAFMSIYSEPISRVTASRWAYENIPTAITAEWLPDGGGPALRTHLPVKKLILMPGAPQTMLMQPDQPADYAGSYALRLTLNHAQGQGEVRARLIDAATGQPVAETAAAVNPRQASLALNFPGVSPGRGYQVEFLSTASEPISARTSVVANEHWDDAVPQPIDGKDAYSMYFDNLSTSSDGQIQNYAEDDPDKLPRVLDWLDEADYLVLSSNRLYASIPRLPWRFPMATEYYRALFAGELGFELAADFHSFPRLGALVFNDQEMPQTLARAPATQGTPPGIQIPYPTAEEAFSVYDHPRVLIFRKTPAYSRALAQQVLGKYDLTRTLKLTPLRAVNTPRGMLFDDRTREAQQAGGTWSELFPRESLLNQSQPLAALAWLALIELLGLAAFPLIAAATSGRQAAVSHQRSAASDQPPATSRQRPATSIDGGYAFAKTLGLLVAGLASWWLASMKIAAFTPLQIWAVYLALAAVGAAVWTARRREMAQLLRSRAPAILAAEAVFLAGFVTWLLVRAANPDLWHPYMGGEKPMDFAYLNGVLRSTWFPPIDPWFAGGYINYYYLGFVIFGAPIKALGIDPAVAYNLLVPTLFGLTACGAFGLGASFVFARARRMRRAVGAGLLAALLAVGVGNWGQPDVIFPAWQELGGIESGTPPLIATLNGIGKWLAGERLPIYPNWPYWNPTRLDSALPIAEFPQFTFLYADLHAHMMAMPIALLAVAFALTYVAGVRRWLVVALGALAVGALWPTNSWDYPIYLALCLGALVIGGLHESPDAGGGALSRVLRVLPVAAAFAILTRAFYLPYLEHFGSAYNSVETWLGEKTPLKPYVIIYGLFLIPLAAYLILGAWREIARRRPGDRGVWFGIGLGILAAHLAVWLATRGALVALIGVPMATLAFLAALRPGTGGSARLLWLMVAGAFALTVFVELFTLRGDIGRMNTVFKFYIQAWLILSVAAPAALAWLAERWTEGSQMMAADGRPTARFQILLRRLAAAAFSAVMIASLLSALMYPAFAIPAKVDDRYTQEAPRGLDGMAYMTRAVRYEQLNGQERQFSLAYDYEAIRWMQDHVPGSPVIIEGTTRGDLYRWGNRFSIYTGLPAVIGWQWHQRQQRAALDDRIVYDRDQDLLDFYNTPDIGQALMLIRRYGARYIVLGDLERVYYDQAGFAKFDRMVEAGYLRVAFRNPGTLIYEVVPEAVAAVGPQPAVGTLGDGR